MNRLRWILATCAGFGYSPILPGTCGALWGIPIFLAIIFGTQPDWRTLHGIGLDRQTGWIALALVVVCAITVWLSDWAENHFEEEDSSRFVTDEIAGFLLTVLLFRPAGATLWIHILASFLVTRVIDIAKVPPARKLENLPGGWGVLADDLLGSVYAALLLWLIWAIVPGWFIL